MQWIYLSEEGEVVVSRGAVLTLENVIIQSVSGKWKFKKNGFKLETGGAELINN